MYKIKCSFIFLFLIFNFIKSNSQVYKISGTIVDSASQNKLPYPTVAFINDQDSVVNEFLANENGEFKTPTKYVIHKIIIKCLGYKDKEIILSENEIMHKNNIHLDKIQMSAKITELGEINIISNLPYYEQKFDRKVFNISQNKAMAANTIYDLLRVLPGVTVDESGNIKYNGASPKIYIENQPYQYIYPSIEQIPVSLVSKIEIIDASMQYGDVGQSGIINIRLKIATEDGLSGLASISGNTTQYKNLDKSNAFCNLNYKWNKIIFYNNSYYQSNFTHTITKTEKSFNAFNYTSDQIIENKMTKNEADYYDYFGLNINFSQRTSLYLGGGAYNYNYENETEKSFHEFNGLEGRILNNYFSVLKSKSNQNFSGANIMFNHSIDTNDRYFWINGNIQYSGYKSLDTSNYLYYILKSQNTDSIYSLFDKSNSHLDRLSLSFFYNHPLNKKTRINIFYNLDFGFREFSKYDRYIDNVLNLPLSKINDLNSQNHLLSVRFGSIIKKWKLDGGINFTFKKIYGNYTRFIDATNDTITDLEKTYFKLAPSATIVYMINEKKEIKFTFTQTNQLPYFSQLINYTDKSNPYLWVSGNPNLKPVFYYATYLGYSYYKENFNYSGNTFYTYTNNEISDIIYPLNSLVSLSKPENCTEKSTLGVDASSWYKISSKTNISASSSLYYIQRNDLYLDKVKELNLPDNTSIKKQMGFNIKSNIQYEFKKIYFTFYVYYKSKEITYYGYNYEKINSSFNIFRGFFNNHLNLSFSIYNITYDLIPIKSYSNRFGMKGYTINDGTPYKRIYFFSIKYKFKQGDRNTKNYRI